MVPKCACGLTGRSSGLPPARHLGREAASGIIRLAAQAPCRWQPLSFNVRQQMRRVCEFTNATAEAWPLNAAQERGDSAGLSLSAQGKENNALRSSSTTSPGRLALIETNQGAGCQLEAHRLSVSNQKNAELSGFRTAVLTSVSEAGTYRSCSSRSLPTAAGRSRLPGNSRQVLGFGLSSLARLRPLRQAAA